MIMCDDYLEGWFNNSSVLIRGRDDSIIHMTIKWHVIQKNGVSYFIAKWLFFLVMLLGLSQTRACTSCYPLSPCYLEIRSKINGPGNHNLRCCMFIFIYDWWKPIVNQQPICISERPNITQLEQSSSATHVLTSPTAFIQYTGRWLIFSCYLAGTRLKLDRFMEDNARDPEDCHVPVPLSLLPMTAGIEMSHWWQLHK